MGAPESYTLDGPPEKIIPFGFSLERNVKWNKFGVYREISNPSAYQVTVL